MVRFKPLYILLWSGIQSLQQQHQNRFKPLYILLWSGIVLFWEVLLMHYTEQYTIKEPAKSVYTYEKA